MDNHADSVSDLRRAASRILVGLCLTGRWFATRAAYFLDPGSVHELDRGVVEHVRALLLRGKPLKKSQEDWIVRQLTSLAETGMSIEHRRAIADEASRVARWRAASGE